MATDTDNDSQRTLAKMNSKRGAVNLKPSTIHVIELGENEK